MPITGVPFLQAIPFCASSFMFSGQSVNKFGSVVNFGGIETGTFAYGGGGSPARNAARFATSPHGPYMKISLDDAGGSGIVGAAETDMTAEGKYVNFFENREPPYIDFAKLRREGELKDIKMLSSYDRIAQTKAIVLAAHSSPVHGDGFGSFFGGNVDYDAFISPRLDDPQMIFLNLTFTYFNYGTSLERRIGGRTWLAALNMLSGAVMVTAVGDGVRRTGRHPARPLDLMRFVCCLERILEGGNGRNMDLIEKMLAATEVKAMDTVDFIVELVGDGGEWETP